MEKQETEAHKFGRICNFQQGEGDTSICRTFLYFSGAFSQRCYLRAILIVTALVNQMRQCWKFVGKLADAPALLPHRSAWLEFGIKTKEQLDEL